MKFFLWRHFIWIKRFLSDNMKKWNFFHYYPDSSQQLLISSFIINFTILNKLHFRLYQPIIRRRPFEMARLKQIINSFSLHIYIFFTFVNFSHYLFKAFMIFIMKNQRFLAYIMVTVFLLLLWIFLFAKSYYVIFLDYH